MQTLPSSPQYRTTMVVHPIELQSSRATFYIIGWSATRTWPFTTSLIPNFKDSSAGGPSGQFLNMSESNSLVMAAWAPGLIGNNFILDIQGSQIGAGFAFASSLYGIALGQSIYYAWHFPGDPRLTKLMPWRHCPYDRECSILLGVAHILPSKQFMDLGMFVTLPVNYATTFAVQSFYGRRVWVISGNNKHITVAILFTAILQFGLGGWCTLEVFHPDWDYRIFLHRSTVSTLCDFLITSAVIKYMYNSDLRKRVNFIQDLAIVFINMGAFTCLMSVLVGVIVTITGWGRPDLPSADASYVNSNLTVLNARRSIRQREERRLEHTIELPTLSRII
ncbi:hypothetical protein BU15DRAFT_63856 [Melanogaster broomeanus]|nr:hypothetical protein BU15DRAFT_63856 [Melanogaster broomeanus]